MLLVEYFGLRVLSDEVWGVTFVLIYLVVHGVYIMFLIQCAVSCFALKEEWKYLNFDGCRCELMV